MATLYNRARMTITSTGTGTLTLGSAVTGYQTFANAGVANGAIVSYVIEDGANWEVGTGTYTSSGTTLSRTVSASSNSGSAISNTTSAQVFITALAADIVNANSGTASGLTATGLKETKTAPTISTNTLTLDCSTGNVFNVSLNANVSTLTFTNVPSSGTAYGLTLSLSITGSFTVTWPASVKWPSATAPTLTTTSGKTDTFVLFTYDGGTTWWAFVAGQNA